MKFAVKLLLTSLCLPFVANANLIVNGSFESTTLDPTGIANGVTLSTLSSTSPKWDVYNADNDADGTNDGGATLEGWTLASGNGIEVQALGAGANAAQDGENRIELDSDANFHGYTGNDGSNSSMIQTISGLFVDSIYELTFWYKARTNLKDDNGINVLWGETAGSQDVVFTADLDGTFNADGESDDSTNLDNWVEYSIELVATATEMVIGFGATGDHWDSSIPYIGLDAGRPAGVDATTRENIQPDYQEVSGNGIGGLLDNVSLTKVKVSEPSPYSVLAFGLLLIGLVRRR